jgi:LPS export ABC transporter protein LptC
VTFGSANAGMINFNRHKNIFFQAAIICSCLFVYSCENDEGEIKKWTQKVVMVDEVREVQSIFSDGGLLKAKLAAPLMLRYQADTVYMEFPKKLHVDFFDSTGKKESQLDARYGKYFESGKKVFLKDSVVVASVKGDTLKCPELWWDQNTGKFYTDSLVRLKTVDKTIYGGKGMRADQDLSNFSFFNATGNILVKEGEGF